MIPAWNKSLCSKELVIKVQGDKKWRCTGRRGQRKSSIIGQWCQHGQQAVCVCSPAIVNVSCCPCHQRAELHGDKQVMHGGNCVQGMMEMGITG